MTLAAPLLQVSGLVTEFRTDAGPLRAVKGVDLTIARGETLALVGESGSGKSVTSLSIMRLIPDRAGRIVSGQVMFHGRAGSHDLVTLDQSQMGHIRGRDIAMIFQEPMTSLNPSYRIGTQIAEAARLHLGLGQKAAWTRAVEALAQVEIPDPVQRAQAYPHQLSGGMRQRVMIAMALVCDPVLLIADEPTTALDSTVQLQILTLLRRLQRDLGMGILFITHNLGVVAEIADRVAVMYGGRIVEVASTADIFARPSHPYTRGLLASLPRVDHAARAAGVIDRLTAIPGTMVDPRNPPPGCDFNPRCSFVTDACRRSVPGLDQVAPDHQSRCLRWRSLDD